MFEKKEEITEMVEVVYRITEDLNRGQILTHGEISQVLGLRPHEGSWDLVMRKIRRRLREERGIEMWPEITVGYKLLTELEQVQVPIWRARKVAYQRRESRKAVQALPTVGLSLHMRRMRQFQLDQAIAAEREHRAEMQALAASFRPTQTLPRPPMALEN